MEDIRVALAQITCPVGKFLTRREDGKSAGFKSIAQTLKEDDEKHDYYQKEYEQFIEDTSELREISNGVATALEKFRHPRLPPVS